MNPEFWHQRWLKNETAFHQTEINAHLQTYFSKLQLKPGSKVFVPLCGKSQDMFWLLSQGFEVIGVELSPLAVQACLSENGLHVKPVIKHGFTIYKVNGLTLYCGDFFNLKQEDLEGVSAVYDRAALVALPVDIRSRYVAHLKSILPDFTQILLLTFEYSQQDMKGPPFSVGEVEVKNLYKPWLDVTVVHLADIINSEPRFRERGLRELSEKVYIIK